ncbi:AraC family transcriptional regulator [Hymenobacter sp. UYCo722]|uniref:helix-turn-helix domain-containing protein n=1 Tax=Hymenobacter sp. UYCo722 TaxID=3156335 RepID=UPI003391CD0F
MLVRLDLAVAFQLFCIAQGLTTAVYLLATSVRQPANKWLGWLLVGLTLQVVDYFLGRSGIYFRNRWLYFTPLFFSWSFGPLLLTYLRVRFGARPLRWVHFLPGMGQALFYAVVCAQSFDTKTRFWLTVHKPWTRYVEHYGAVLSMGVYLALAYRLVRQQAHPAPWLLRGLLVVGLFFGLAALDPLINRWYLPAGAPKFYLTGVVLPVVAYGVSLVGWLKNRSVGTRLLAGLRVDVTAKKPAGPVDADQLRRVVAALEQESLYKDPDLTLARLAQHLDLAPNAVSQLLNAGLGQSFSDVVNGYRLDEVKRRLLTADAQRLTLLALAFDAGFNSKSTFNRVFKEKLGITPKEYQKKSQITN